MGSSASGVPVEVLRVENNPGDVRLTREAFKDGKLCNSLSVVHGSVEAIAYLRRQESYTVAPRPDVILLDRGLPRKDGRKFLREVTADPALSGIPVVIVMPPEDNRDVVRIFSLPAVCCASEPVGLEQFMTVVPSVQNFLLAIVRGVSAGCGGLETVLDEHRGFSVHAVTQARSPAR